MKNRFFRKMQREGILYRKKIAPTGITTFNRLFSKGESMAFMYWSIAERYHSTDIFVDELSDERTNEEMINTFRKAGIGSIVIGQELQERCCELERFGCRMIGECKVFRRETELYNGSLEVLKGYRLSV